MIARCAPLVLLAIALPLSSCRKPVVEAYRVPKEAAAAPSPAAGAPMAGPGVSAAPGAAPMASTAVATAAGADLAWTAPSSWKTKPASAMRKGSYAVTADGVAGEADLSITAFPGDVGGELANLNRWRGQVELPPVGQAELASTTQHVDRNGLHMTIVDLVGTAKGAPTRIVGAMVPHGGATWFFKLTGPDALVAKEKPAFLAFLDTVKPAAP